MQILKITLLILVAAALAGCGPVPLKADNPEVQPTVVQTGKDASGTGPEPVPATMQPGLIPEAAAPEPSDDLQDKALEMLKTMQPVTAEVRQALAEKADQDLIKRAENPLLVPEINSIDVTVEIWADSSLGCDSPERSPDAQLTPGYQIILQSIGRQYVYYADMDKNLVTCENPRAPLTGLLSLVEKARQDLAERRSIQAADITLVETRTQTWPDTSLGCQSSTFSPEPGPTDGYVIILKAGEEQFEYHADKLNKVLYCEKPAQAAPVVDSDAELVKADLAKRLSIQPADIQVVRSEEVTWSDTSLGCPKPGMMYAQVLTPGYLIVLQTPDSLYEYHAGSDRVFTLCEDPLPPSN